MTVDDLLKAVENTTPEEWQRLREQLRLQEKKLDDLCASGDHQGHLINPTFSGSDAWWRCSRCGRSVYEKGGNTVFTI